MSVFSTWLQAEMDANGWDQRAAAKAIGVQETTVHNWLHQNKTPSAGNIFRIVRATKKPIEVVASAAHYDESDEVAVFATEEEAAAARTALLANLPQFQDIIEAVARKPLEEQAVIIAMIRRLLVDPPPGSDLEPTQ